LLASLEENGTTFGENAKLKAAHLLTYAQSVGASAVLGDDSGLVLPALNGYLGLAPFPGLHSNRWLTPALKAELLGLAPSEPVTHYEKCLAILHLLQGKPPEQRRGAFVCALALLPVPSEGKSPWLTAPVCVEAAFNVQILEADAPRGEHGFGYDAIALPLKPETELALPQTLAQLPEAFKQKHSHRALALEALLHALAKQQNFQRFDSSPA
jgi:XTP/dITP diphosphohydrolase